MVLLGDEGVVMIAAGLLPLTLRERCVLDWERDRPTRLRRDGLLLGLTLGGGTVVGVAGAGRVNLSGSNGKKVRLSERVTGGRRDPCSVPLLTTRVSSSLRARAR